MTKFPDARKVTFRRGVMADYECGCLVIRHDGGEHLIHACPMHNAAPELLAACEAAADYLETVEQFGRREQKLMIQLEEALTQAGYRHKP